MTSVCTGCACEEACGRMNRSACANRKPIAWRSCDPLVLGRIERDHHAMLSRISEGYARVGTDRAVLLHRASQRNLSHERCDENCKRSDEQGA